MLKRRNISGYFLNLNFYTELDYGDEREKGKKKRGRQTASERERQPEKEMWIDCKQIMIEQDKYTIKRSKAGVFLLPNFIYLY